MAVLVVAILVCGRFGRNSSIVASQPFEDRKFVIFGLTNYKQKFGMIMLADFTDFLEQKFEFKIQQYNGLN